MARKLLSAAPIAAVSTLASARVSPGVGLSGAKLDARLRMKRSSAYIEAIRKLDAGGHTHDRQAVEAVLAAIREELPEITIDQLPVGIVAKCFLGEPYEVHTLDRLLTIVHHYKRLESLPALLGRGKVLAASGKYAFVEVYTDKVIAVSEGGDVSIVRD